MSCRAPRPSIARTIPMARRCVPACAPPSSIPIAGSMMRGWSCSTRATRRGAARRSSPAPSWCRRDAPATAGRRASSAATGATHDVAARILVNAGGPWVTDVLHRCGLSAVKAELRLVKGSHIVVPRLYRRRAGLSLAERRSPRRLRAALRAGLHADRHHRHPLCRRTRRRRHRCGRDGVSLPRRVELAAPSRDAGAGGVELCRRPPAL